jgi:hypothetical protein
MTQEYQPDLMNLARLARKREGFIAKPLFAYQDARQLSDEELALAVGVPVDQLSHLALCGLPQKDADVATIVAHVKADGPTLSAWLKTEIQNPLPDWAQPGKKEETE